MFPYSVIALQVMEIAGNDISIGLQIPKGIFRDSPKEIYYKLSSKLRDSTKDF